MTTQAEINSEIDEQLQLLAGDIFIQLEDRFNQLAAKISEHAEIDKQQALKKQKLELNEKNSAVHEKLSQSKHDSVNLKFSEIEQLKKKLLTYEAKYSALKERAIQIETHLKIKLKDEQQALEDLRLTKENRELLQSQLEPLNKQVTGLAKDKEKLLKDVEKLENKYQQLQQSSDHDIAELKATFIDGQQNQQTLKTDFDLLNKSHESLKAQIITVESDKTAAEKLTVSLKKEHKAATDKLLKSHNERLKVYEQASGSSTDALKTLEQQLDKSKQATNNLQGEISNLKNQIIAVESDKKAAERLTASLKKEHKTATDKLLKSHNERLKVYEQASGSSTDALKTLEQQLDKSQQTTNNLQNEISDLKSQIKSLKQESKTLTVESKNLVKAHEQAIAKLEKEHKTAISAQDKLLKVKQKECDKQLLALDKLATKEQQQNTKINKQSLQLKTLETDISDLNIKCECINEVHEKALSTQQQSFDKQLATLAKDKNGITETIAEFEQKLSSADVEQQNLKQQISDIKTAQQVELNKINNDYSNKEQSLKNSLSTSKIQATDLQQQVDKLTLSLNAEQQDVAGATANLKKQLADTENLLEQSEKQQKSTWVQNSALKDKITSKDEQLEELRSKNSQINSQLISQREKSEKQLNAVNKEQKQLLEQANLQAETKQYSQQNKISDLELQLSTALKRLENHQNKTDEIIEKLNKDKDSIQSQYEQLQHSSANGTSEVTRLERLLEFEREKIAEYVQKNAAIKSRQDSSDVQIRHTLKDLRDENHELKRQLSDELAEMESKVTEYRLKFEYAQKQIAIG
ncbi:hypothetical protein RI844_14345 [Thalassotalea fonticola]|uniref:Uncharacterized protein n=1 Tax=Thalassotalea fonticola TaxID=3065649 RepID=A0ABZ0GKY3_9GAMM|nr:hypothetical protein RI844_14345 [Colwelliaceae bacterium S1-1]